MGRTQGKAALGLATWVMPGDPGVDDDEGTEGDLFASGGLYGFAHARTGSLGGGLILALYQSRSEKSGSS